MDLVKTNKTKKQVTNEMKKQDPINFIKNDYK